MATNKVKEITELLAGNSTVDGDEITLTILELREYIESIQGQGSYDDGFEAGIREAVNRIEWG